jgi:hypothetical protein
MPIGTGSPPKRKVIRVAELVAQPGHRFAKVSPVASV